MTPIHYFTALQIRSLTWFLTGLKPRCLQGWILSGDSEDKLFPCFFEILQASHSPGLEASSPIFKVSSGGSSPSPTVSPWSSVVPSLSLPLSSTFKESYDYVGTTCIIQNNSDVSWLATLIPCATLSPLCPVVTDSGDEDMDILWGLLLSLPIRWMGK